MKDFHCRDVGSDCNFVARGNSNKEILDQVAQHAQNDHQMPVTPETSLGVVCRVQPAVLAGSTRSGA